MFRMVRMMAIIVCVEFVVGDLGLGGVGLLI